MKTGRTVWTRVLMGALAALTLHVAPAFAAAPAIAWEKTYAGLDRAAGACVQPTSDGGYIAAGQTYEPGAFQPQAYLVKTDANGDQQWTQTYGYQVCMVANFVQQTADGGYIVTGYAAVGTGAFQSGLSLVKTDASGNVAWSRQFVELDADAEGYCVRQTSDGSYIAVGYSGYFATTHRDPRVDVYLVRTDAGGNVIWKNLYGGTDVDGGASVVQTSDGGFVVGGYKTNTMSGQPDPYLFKTDSNGTLLWEKTYPGSMRESLNSIDRTTDGGFILTGGYRTFLVKTDASGNSQWEQTLSSSYQGFSVQQTQDGGYIVGGGAIMFMPFPMGTSIYIVKASADGSMEWEMEYAPTSSNGILSIRQTSDQGFIACGFALTELLLLKLGQGIPTLDARAWRLYE